MRLTRLICFVLLLGLAVNCSAAVEAGLTVEEETRIELSRLAGEVCPVGAAVVEFGEQTARFIRFQIHRTFGGQACVDELEIYGPAGDRNLALAAGGAKATASSALDHPLHKVAHLNDGQYGNPHSWIPQTDGVEWAQIELPEQARVSRMILSRDRTGGYRDRQPAEVEILVSQDGQAWTSVARQTYDASPFAEAGFQFPAAALSDKSWAGVVEYAFLRERETWATLNAEDYLSPLVHDRPANPGGEPYWGRLARMDATTRTLTQFGDLIERLSKRGVDTTRERETLQDLRRRAAENLDAKAADALYLQARQAKRDLFFRDPLLASLDRVLFAKHHPLKSSHNYSDHFDSLFAPGGGIYVLEIPRDGQGRLDPAHGHVRQLFDASKGIARHPVCDFEARTVYFAYRPDKPEVDGWKSYWHLWSVNADGGGLRRLTEGPFHDFDPVVLPDGGLGFMSTRCHVRFLCWRPQAYVLHRMEPDGSGIRRLSHANLSEWDPSIMSDGRILWTRSEYQDKGADFGHTLWAIRPDGTGPELVFGNDTPYSYGHACEVPESREVVATLISHGDHQGPTVLIDLSRQPYDTAAIVNITPDTPPQYQMDRSYSRTFRDPTPVSRDHFLVSHNPGDGDHWGLYLIDRYGNRELLYLDPRISSKRPSPLRPRSKPPVLASAIDPNLAARGLGEFVVQDVYEGLGSGVERGTVRYLRVVEEVPSGLDMLPSGEYCADHEAFEDFYASPVHLVQGPPRSYLTRTRNALEPHSFRTGSAVSKGDVITITENLGWPSFVAKAAFGTVEVAPDGSAKFLAPAGKVLYFQALDAQFNEIQRMRSVVQLQPGEQRGCIGCHDDRRAVPRSRRPGTAMASAAQPLTPPPWGAGPFDYQRVVQPVLNNRCAACHDGRPEFRPDLRGVRDPNRVPASYRSLITGGWVHYFDWAWGSRHFKAEPFSFGTLQSPLFTALKSEAHRDVHLEPEELRALKEWIDLNCPLWPDYQYRLDRPQ
ncbi:MAG: discoidin domain-containing protein [Phycisphaerales bacterium]